MSQQIAQNTSLALCSGPAPAHEFRQKGQRTPAFRRNGSHSRKRIRRTGPRSLLVLLEAKSTNPCLCQGSGPKTRACRSNLGYLWHLPSRQTRCARTNYPSARLARNLHRCRHVISHQSNESMQSHRGHCCAHLPMKRSPRGPQRRTPPRASPSPGPRNHWTRSLLEGSGRLWLLITDGGLQGACACNMYDESWTNTSAGPCLAVWCRAREQRVEDAAQITHSQSEMTAPAAVTLRSVPKAWHLRKEMRELLARSLKTREEVDQLKLPRLSIQHPLSQQEPCSTAGSATVGPQPCRQTLTRS